MFTPYDQFSARMDGCMEVRVKYVKTLCRKKNSLSGW